MSLHALVLTVIVLAFLGFLVGLLLKVEMPPVIRSLIIGITIFAVVLFAWHMAEPWLATGAAPMRR
jgi:VIT1/CCC1 family predicted Fe2+/Mn2+ transporter